MNLYEKKYKEAQGWIEKIYPTLQHEQQMEAESFFPELKESEDEKIRKRIIHALHGDVLDMEETTKAIAWLEKQGEQKPQRMISAEAKEAMYDKPACAWSEEDKEILRTIISDGLRGAEFDMLQINWLKSLKQRIGG